MCAMPYAPLQNLVVTNNNNMPIYQILRLCA
jgi:hypothetical protein